MKSGGGLGCPGSQGCTGAPCPFGAVRRAGDRHAARGAGRRACRGPAAAGARRRALPARPDRAARRRAGRRDGRTTGWWSRARTGRTSSRDGSRGGRGGWPRSGRRRLRRSLPTASTSTSCLAWLRRRGCWTSSHGLRAACSSPPRRARGACSSTSSKPTSSRSTAPSSSGRRSCRRATSRCSPRAPPPGLWPRSGSSVPAVSIGPQTTAAAEAAGVRVVAEAETHDVEGIVSAVARLAS